MEEIWSRGAVDIAKVIRERLVSSVEVVQAFLQRIEEVNPAINSVVVTAPERAIEEARAADASLALGHGVGPLHGVPFTAKDVFDTAGVETSAGIHDRIGVVPKEDAVAIARMRRAGAILLGKTNVPPGGSGGVTDNEVHGSTNNPYDPARSPAGSSGGEAATQAAGASPVGLGSDSGGSLRVPAHYCGVAALKPTTGRIPNTGAFEHPGGLSDTRTQIGPISRFVQDLAPVFEILVGPDGRDSGVVPMPVGDPEAVELAGLRVAFYTDDGSTPTTPDTVAAVRDAADTLSSAGAQVTERCPERIGADSLDISARYWSWEQLLGGESVRLLAEWDAFRTRMLAFMESVDIILCPTAPGPAPLTVKVLRRPSTTRSRSPSPASPPWSFPPAAQGRGCQSACRSWAECGEKPWRSLRHDVLRPRSEAGAGHLSDNSAEVVSTGWRWTRHSAPAHSPTQDAGRGKRQPHPQSTGQRVLRVHGLTR